MHLALPPDVRAKIAGALRPDGSLRDLLILETTLDDWRALMDFVRSAGYRTGFERDGEVAEMPSDVAALFTAAGREHTYLWRIHHGGIDIHCHFFELSKIDMNVHPREIKSDAEIDALVDFIFLVGKHLRRDVLLAKDGWEPPLWDDVIASYEPSTDAIRIGCRPRQWKQSKAQRRLESESAWWRNGFWIALGETVEGWGLGVDLSGRGDARGIGPIKVFLLLSGDAGYVLAFRAIPGSRDVFSRAAETTEISPSKEAPHDAARRVARSLEAHVAAALREKNDAPPST